MSKQLEAEVKVGLFVSIGLGLILLAILLLGGAENYFTRNNRYYAHFENVDGLIVGAKIVLSGVRVGAIEGIDFDQKTQNIKITLGIAREYENWIRKDSTAEIATQGVLGDKYIALTKGTPEAQTMAPESEIDNKPSKDLTQFLSSSEQLMASLNTIAKSMDRLLVTFEHENRSEAFFKGMAQTASNMSLATDKLNKELDQLKLNSAVKNLNSILNKINNGTGTLGALVNDSSLYDDAKAFMGGVNRNRIMRNLIRKTIKDAEEEESQESK